MYLGFTAVNIYDVQTSLRLPDDWPTEEERS
jgi:hypothetical protein